jgi:hypothetical protein
MPLSHFAEKVNGFNYMNVCSIRVFILLKIYASNKN